MRPTAGAAGRHPARHGGGKLRLKAEQVRRLFARSTLMLLLYDSNRAVWSEGARVAPERPRAGRWVEGGHHAIGQATRGRSRGQRAALEGRAQTCCTCTCTCTWVQRVLVVRKAERAVRCGSKRDASAGRHGCRRQERRGWRGGEREAARQPFVPITDTQANAPKM